MSKQSIFIIVFALFILGLFLVQNHDVENDALEKKEICLVDDIEPSEINLEVRNNGIYVTWEHNTSDCYYEIDSYHLTWRDEYMFVNEEGKEKMVHNVFSINLPRSENEYFITNVCKSENGFDGEYPDCMKPLDDGVIYQVDLGFIADDINRTRGEYQYIKFEYIND